MERTEKRRRDRKKGDKRQIKTGKGGREERKKKITWQRKKHIKIMRKKGRASARW